MSDAGASRSTETENLKEVFTKGKKAKVAKSGDKKKAEPKKPKAPVKPAGDMTPFKKAVQPKAPKGKK